MLTHEVIYLISGVFLVITLLSMSALITRAVIRFVPTTLIYYKIEKYRKKRQGLPHFICTNNGIVENPEFYKYPGYHTTHVACGNCEIDTHHSSFKSVHVYMDEETFIELKLTN